MMPRYVLLAGVLVIGQLAVDIPASKHVGRWWTRVLPATLVANGALGSEPSDSGFAVDEKTDRLLISLRGQPIAEYVFVDPRILRPYFARVRTPGGLAVTRNHPPVAGTDATDHDSMHPGIWLAFGDINGHDFWRNKARIEHLRFVTPPTANADRLTFSTLSRLLTEEDHELCRLTSRFTLRTQQHGWLLDWDATFQSDSADFTFGDQEEMGFAARVGTPLIEKKGGRIVSSTGRRSAAATWGQPAKWCDYAGQIGDQTAGITLVPSPDNFRECWWHNRDYGLFVANPFGRAALRQGDKSSVTVRRGDAFRLRFVANVHQGPDYDPTAECQRVQEYFGATR